MPTDGSEEGFMSKETGRVAWLLWRSAYFTTTLSIRNKYIFFTKVYFTSTDDTVKDPGPNILVLEL